MDTGKALFHTITGWWLLSTLTAAACAVLWLPWSLVGIPFAAALSWLTGRAVDTWGTR